MTEEFKPLCPGCGGELAAAVAPRMACPSCEGVWLAESLLRNMLEEMNMHASSMPFSAAAAQTPRACPICTTTMDSVQLLGIPLDRCGPHGVYCDPGELQSVLQKSVNVPAPRVADMGSVPDVREHSETMKRAIWGTNSTSLGPRRKGLIGLLIDAILGLAK